MSDSTFSLQAIACQESIRAPGHPDLEATEPHRAKPPGRLWAAVHLHSPHTKMPVRLQGKTAAIFTPGDLKRWGGRYEQHPEA